MIHTLDENDLPHLLALSQEAGWDHTEADWRTILHTGRAFGHRDEAGHAVSSCVFTGFGSALAALGMLLVREKVRGLGLGKELMRHALSLKDARPLMLCAATSSEGYYEKFGFRTVEYLFKLRAPAGVSVPDSGFADKVEMRSLTAEELDRVLPLDRQVLGADRSDLLRARLHQAEGAVMGFKHGAETLLGYGLSIRQGNQRLIGPVVAFNRHVAIELVRALLNEGKGPVRIDVYAQRQDFAEELKQAGFNEEDRQPVMLLGADSLGGRRDHLFALAAQTWC